MAASGNSLGLILAAGERRSAAYLHYVNEEMAEKSVNDNKVRVNYRGLADKANETLDSGAMLKVALEESDEDLPVAVAGRKSEGSDAKKEGSETLQR